MFCIQKQNIRRSRDLYTWNILKNAFISSIGQTVTHKQLWCKNFIIFSLIFSFFDSACICITSPGSVGAVIMMILILHNCTCDSLTQNPALCTHTPASTRQRHRKENLCNIPKYAVYRYMCCFFGGSGWLYSRHAPVARFGVLVYEYLRPLIGMTERLHATIV